MLHLLPEQQKKLVLVEYHKRLGITVCLFTFSIALVGTILLLPSYIIAHGRLAKVQEKENLVDSQLAQISAKGSGDIVKSVTDTISALAPKGPTADASTVFDQFLATEISGIQVTHLGYTVNADNTITLDVDGSASDRDTLVAFADSVNRSGQFTGAYVPLSSLRSDKDIIFSFKLGVKDMPAATSSSTPQ